MHFIIKRSGIQEPVCSEKITLYLKKLCYGLDMKYIDFELLSDKILIGIFNNITTKELNKLSAETAASMTTEHPDYSILAARIAITALHKNTKKKFSDVIQLLHNYIHPKNQKHLPVINDELYAIVMSKTEKINSAIIYERDFDYNYFGFKTLERSYLLRINGEVVERPQHLLMRVALGIHKSNIEQAIEVKNEKNKTKNLYL